VIALALEKAGAVRYVLGRVDRWWLFVKEGGGGGWPNRRARIVLFCFARAARVRGGGVFTGTSLRPLPPPHPLPFVLPHVAPLCLRALIRTLEQLMGPENAAVARVEARSSIRGRFGVSAVENAIHGSASADAANREVRPAAPCPHQLSLPALCLAPSPPCP
jgi:hypothetical protein